MSDPKRATLITVDAPKSAKKNVTKIVRLDINLVESNESKYTELNYKDLVIAEAKKHKVVNGKTDGLDPFSDNDEDVVRVARKFEQKYGGTSAQDEYADIGMGYDENDSFIDNTDGYDEMIPPECDTILGGFYINSGSLEFKSVPENQQPHSDGEQIHRRNKRRISSSSSEEDTTESSSSNSRPAKAAPSNGIVTNNNEHRKKKIKKAEKKAKRVKRNDSSAATSGKQTSDDAHASAESENSRTSQSDSVTSKPGPSSENAATSDSSRDVPDSKLESTLPSPLKKILDEMKNCIARMQLANSHVSVTEICKESEPFLLRLDSASALCDVNSASTAWSVVSRILSCDKATLIARIKTLKSRETSNNVAATQPPPPSNTTTVKPQQTGTKRKAQNNNAPVDYDKLTPQDREMRICQVLERLKVLIDEQVPAMLARYKSECERVQEEKKKLQNTDAQHVEKRKPKRRFPWCHRARALLCELSRLSASPAAAAALLASRALPLFPKGFVRMPTLLRQACLKTEDLMKRPRSNSNSAPQPTTITPNPLPTFSEPIHFPSSLTVTTTLKTSPDKTETVVVSKNESQYTSILNNYSAKKDHKDEKKEQDRSKDYIPPNSIGSITITPVNNAPKTDKPVSKPVNTVTMYEKQKEPLIRVKSPAALIKEANDIKAKKDRDKTKIKEKKILNTPLHVDTNFQPKEKVTPSPNNKKDEITNKTIEKVKHAEENIPRPVLVPIHHSPTFAKPDKRPPDNKKKKDIVIVSDVDPLSDASEPLAIDDSSSDVELVEDNKSEVKSDSASVKVPSKDNALEINEVRDKIRGSDTDNDPEVDIDAVMKNIRDLQDSQVPSFTSNSYDSVMSNEPTSLSNTDGCNGVTG